MEVAGERENGRARGRHARGETITLAEFMKNAPAGNRLGHTVKLDLIKELSSYSLAF